MEEEEHSTEGRGRSAKKREAQEIAGLAARAAELPELVLASLSLEEPVSAALTQLRQTSLDPRYSRDNCWGRCCFIVSTQQP